MPSSTSSTPAKAFDAQSKKSSSSTAATKTKDNEASSSTKGKSAVRAVPNGCAFFPDKEQAKPKNIAAQIQPGLN